MNQLKKSATLIISSALEKNVINNYNYKIMLLKRNNKMRAAPNYHVYPGGKYDKNIDESLNWLDIFFNVKQLNEIKSNPILLHKHYFNGIINQNSLGHLMKGQFNGKLALPLELSFRLCAIRETFEETGLLLAFRKINSSDNFESNPKLNTHYFSENFHDLKSWHKIIKKDSSEFINMFYKLSLVPDIFGLHEWANWITPTHEKYRFDTYFFTCFLSNVPNNQLIDINKDEIDTLEVII